MTSLRNLAVTVLRPSGTTSIAAALPTANTVELAYRPHRNRRRMYRLQQENGTPQPAEAARRRST